MIQPIPRPRLAGLPLALALALGVPSASAADKSPCIEVVEKLHGVALEVMKRAETLGYAGRAARLAPVLDESLDLRFMAEKSVGRYWREASEQMQERLLKTFRRYIIATYAGRFDGYSGQRFETVAEEPALRDTKLVRTRITAPNEDPIALDYRLWKTGGSWKIVDVYLNGTVSELGLRRSEYTAVIKRDGLEALLVALEEKIARFASGTAGRL